MSDKWEPLPLFLCDGTLCSLCGCALGEEHAPGCPEAPDENFIGYVLSFYGPGGMYQRFFDPVVTKEEVAAAVKIRKAHKRPPFSGDTLDRELVRDIMFARRGDVEDVEYPRVLDWIKEGGGQ